MSELREELAAALPPHQTWCQAIGHSDCCGKTDADCDCGIAASLDALLPVVRRYAARELEAWARSFRACGQAGLRRDNRRVLPQVADVLEAGARDLRADALEADE